MSFKGKKNLNNSRGNSSHQGYLLQTVRLTLQKSKQLTWLLLLCIYNSPLFQSSKQSCWKRHFLTILIFTDASVCKWYTREKLRIEVNRSQTRMRICIIRKKTLYNCLNDCIFTGNIRINFIRWNLWSEFNAYYMNTFFQLQ